MSIIGGGKIGVSATSVHGTFRGTLFVNANKDLLVLVSRSTTLGSNSQEIQIFQRAPVYAER